MPAVEDGLSVDTGDDPLGSSFRRRLDVRAVDDSKILRRNCRDGGAEDIDAVRPGSRKRDDRHGVSLRDDGDAPHVLPVHGLIRVRLEGARAFHRAQEADRSGGRGRGRRSAKHDGFALDDRLSAVASFHEALDQHGIDGETFPFEGEQDFRKIHGDAFRNGRVEFEPRRHPVRVDANLVAAVPGRGFRRLLYGHARKELFHVFHEFLKVRELQILSRGSHPLFEDSSTRPGSRDSGE